MFSTLRLILLALAVCSLIPCEMVQAQSLSPVQGGSLNTPTRGSPLASAWNPAAVGMSKTLTVETNLTFMGGWLVYDRDGVDPNTNQQYESSRTSQFVPNPYLAVSIPFPNTKFNLGYSTYFPGGSVANFSSSGSQRYDLIAGRLVPWHHQLSIAYRVSDQLSFGLSGIMSVNFLESKLDIDFSSLMKNVLDSDTFRAEHPALAAHAHVKPTTAIAGGFAMGMLYRPSYRWAFGLSYFSPIEYSFHGDLNVNVPSIIGAFGPTFAALGVRSDQPVRNTFRAHSAIPAYLQAGVLYRPLGYWTSEVFARYAFASFQQSLALQIEDSELAGLKGVEVPGGPLDDTWLLGTVQSFSLWKRWETGLYTAFYKNGTRDDQMALSQADFDSLLTGLFVRYAWTKSFQLSAEYVHSLMFNRHAAGTKEADTTRSAFFAPMSKDGLYRTSIDRLSLTVKYAY